MDPTDLDPLGGGTSDDAQEPTSLWRFLFGGTLMLAMAAGTFTTFAIGSLAPFITVDLALSRTELGLLVTLLYVGGGGGSWFLGTLADRGQPQLLLVVLFLTAGGSWLLMGWLRSMEGLILGVLVASVALSLTNPATNKLMAAHVPLGRQGLLVGVKQSGVPFGQFLAGTALPMIASASGWNRAFALASGMAGVGLVGSLLAVPRGRRVRRARHVDATRAKMPGARWLTGYAFFMGLGVAPTGTYLALYGFEVLNLSAVLAGALTGLVGIVGVVGRIAWASYAERRGATAATLGLLAWGSLISIVLVALSPVFGAVAIVLGAVLYGLTAVAWNAVGMLAIVRDADYLQAGAVSGQVQAAFYLGFVASPTIFGLAVDHLHSYGAAWVGVAVSFLAAAVIGTSWHMREQAESLL